MRQGAQPVSSKVPAATAAKVAHRRVALWCGEVFRGMVRALKVVVRPAYWQTRRPYVGVGHSRA